MTKAKEYVATIRGCQYVFDSKRKLNKFNKRAEAILRQAALIRPRLCCELNEYLAGVLFNLYFEVSAIC